MKEINYISEIVNKAKKNNVLAQKILYETFAKEMLLLSYRMVGNMEEAKDILQESFIKAFQNIDKLKEPSKFKSWLKRIIINNCLQHIKRRIYFENVDFVSDVIDENEERWYEEVSFEQITGEIQKLPIGCKQIFILYLFENYKHKEISELLNISESTSKSQYQRALKLLQEKLKNYLQ